MTPIIITSLTLRSLSLVNLFLEKFIHFVFGHSNITLNQMYSNSSSRFMMSLLLSTLLSVLNIFVSSPNNIKFLVLLYKYHLYTKETTVGPILIHVAPHKSILGFPIMRCTCVYCCLFERLLLTQSLTIPLKPHWSVFNIISRSIVPNSFTNLFKLTLLSSFCQWQTFKFYKL